MGEHGTAHKADNNRTRIDTNGDNDAPACRADERHAEGTRQVYRRAVKRFDERLGGRLETDAELAAHLDHMFAEGLSPSYASVVVAAVADRAECDARPSPAGELTARSLAAFRRNGAGRGTGQVAGIGWKDAKRMAKRARARGDLAGLRDALYIRIASACLLRVSEASALDDDDISFAADGGLLVRIRRSKTDQEGAGSTHYAGTPVAALLRRWLKAAGIAAGPLFRRIHRTGAVGDGRLGVRTLRDIAKRRAAAAGIQGRVSGHSFRIGAAQSMRAARARLTPRSWSTAAGSGSKRCCATSANRTRRRARPRGCASASRRRTEGRSASACTRRRSVPGRRGGRTKRRRSPGARRGRSCGGSEGR